MPLDEEKDHSSLPLFSPRLDSTWAVSDKQELIDLIETVYRGASKGRGLVVAPKGECGGAFRRETGWRRRDADLPPFSLRSARQITRPDTVSRYPPFNVCHDLLLTFDLSSPSNRVLDGHLRLLRCSPSALDLSPHPRLPLFFTIPSRCVSCSPYHTLVVSLLLNSNTCTFLSLATSSTARNSSSANAEVASCPQPFTIASLPSFPLPLVARAML